MRTQSPRFVAQLLVCLVLIAVSTASASTPPPSTPNPVISLAYQEFFEANGKSWVRFRYHVENFAEFPDSMFAAAPALPPCGKNLKASRTWVDLYDQSGKRLQGFCAFGKASDLNSMWFAVEEGVVPPSWIYVELTDRQTSTKFKSNLAETSL